jgi:hypothetical protein
LIAALNLLADVFSHDMATWLDAVFSSQAAPVAPVPAGIVLKVPG